jgi:hypothetical protein
MLFFTFVAVDFIFTMFQTFSRTLIGNLYKHRKNLERYGPKYIYLRLRVKYPLVFSIVTKLNWLKNLSKNPLRKI